MEITLNNLHFCIWKLFEEIKAKCEAVIYSAFVTFSPRGTAALHSHIRICNGELYIHTDCK